VEGDLTWDMLLSSAAAASTDALAKAVRPVKWVPVDPCGAIEPVQKGNAQQSWSRQAQSRGRVVSEWRTQPHAGP
jgi:hypothetical protein